MNFELWKAWPRIYWALGQLDTKIMATKPNIFFEVGEIRPAQESDFEHFIGLADGGGWTKKMEKHGLLVWTRNTENSFVKMFKVPDVCIFMPLYIIYTCNRPAKSYVKCDPRHKLSVIVLCYMI